MRVLDLFAGLGGWSAPFRDRGHEVFSVDIDKRFDVDLHEDINKLDVGQLPWRPDIILASPPCEAFSVMTIGRNWYHDNTPKTQKAADSIVLVKSTINLVEQLHPTWWVIENPRGKLRKLDFMQGFERQTVTYCQYGESYMKPTDLWGDFPPSLSLRPMCKNGDPCHVSAARGSSVGVQDKRLRTKFRGGMIDDMSRIPSWDIRRKQLSAERAKIPYQLSLEICKAAEEG